MTTNIKNLIEYLKPEKIDNLNENENFEITGISFNSKTVESGNIFVCIKGEHSDGHDFAENAVNNGAIVIISAKELPVKTVPVLQVKDTELALAQPQPGFMIFRLKK